MKFQTVTAKRKNQQNNETQRSRIRYSSYQQATAGIAHVKRGLYIYIYFYINSQHTQNVFKKMKSILVRATSREEIASAGVLSALSSSNSESKATINKVAPARNGKEKS